MLEFVMKKLPSDTMFPSQAIDGTVPFATMIDMVGEHGAVSLSIIEKTDNNDVLGALDASSKSMVGFSKSCHRNL